MISRTGPRAISEIFAWRFVEVLNDVKNLTGGVLGREEGGRGRGLG